MIYVQAEVILPFTHASGNQLNHNTKTNSVYRTESYHEYQNYVADALQELSDELGWKVPKDMPLQVKIMFTYEIPKSRINTKAKKEQYESGKILPITRSTKDLDNSAKAVGDALQMAFDFDDSQFVQMLLGKRYGEDNRLYIEIGDA